VSCYVTLCQLLFADVVKDLSPKRLLDAEDDITPIPRNVGRSVDVTSTLETAHTCSQGAVRISDFLSFRAASFSRQILIHAMRCTDSLGAGRSGDRMPVRARFFAHVQTSPGAY
jgi:hypothetical protein